MKKFSFLWITGPWETMAPYPGETTLRLAQEAIDRGHSCFWADVRSVRLEKGHSVVDAQRFLRIDGARREEDITVGPPRPARVATFSQVHYRTDPPIDLGYMHPLQILCRGEAREIVNPPEVLLGVSEKFPPAELRHLMPPTLIAAQKDPLWHFLRKEKKAVLKPLHQAQSKGIELIDLATRSKADIEAAFSAATVGFSRPALLQRFLPAIAHGETRLWFLDGSLLSYATKLPLRGDFRVDIDRGSGLAPARLTAGEKKSATAIGKALKKRGVRLAAIDLIENRITDFNVTSPGLIPQMEELLGVDLAGPIIRKLPR